MLASLCRSWQDLFVVWSEAGKGPPVTRRSNMAHYLLSVHSVAGEIREPMTDDEMKESFRQIGILEAEMKSSHSLVLSGRLHEPDTATVVRISNGEVLTTDGPFAESKEHLGGFYIIEADNLDAALAWATKVSKTIPVRPGRWEPWRTTGFG